ncbi:MAG: ATP-binding protein, partial [Verrucomicrobiota bacterium]
VQTSNDRYANLETNFLLQRLESFEGIVFITTNARDRIDTAFERRMDVIVEFHPPDAAERWALWRSHLPENCDVEDALVRELASRCTLTGGQIRNTVLHATLLALERGGPVTAQDLERAVRREYARSGAVCPLRY